MSSNKSSTDDMVVSFFAMLFVLAIIIAVYLGCAWFIFQVVNKIIEHRPISFGDALGLFVAISCASRGFSRKGKNSD